MTILRVLKILFFILIGIITISGLLILIGMLIPVNKNFRQAKDGVDIYIGTNGFHAEFILPSKNIFFDLTKIINPADFQINTTTPFHYGIGWGDRGIYLDIKEWSEVTFQLGFNSLVLPSTSIMHVKSYQSLPHQKYEIKKISISPTQYKQLCEFVFTTFTSNENKEVQLVEGASYTKKDNFYKSPHKYHALYTCNTWVNKGLKDIGVRTALWTPIDRGLFYQLRKIKE